MTSERVDQLEPPEEVFYRRLLNKVDDHGLYDARVSILRANLFPLRLEKVREADISRWMAACQKAGLIALYENGGKPYLVAFNTGWDKRSKPKYPLPPENICKQVQTTDNTSTVVVVEVVGEGGRKRRTRTKTAESPLPEGFSISDRVKAWAVSHGVFNLAEHFEFFVSRAKAKAYTYADWDEALMGAIRKDWAGIGKGKPEGKKVTPV